MGRLLHVRVFCGKHRSYAPGGQIPPKAFVAFLDKLGIPGRD